MLPTRPFGATGHDSSRIIFGAAAFSRMRQERCDPVMEMLLEFGVNHIDTAAMYGDSELRLAPWMQSHRDQFFLATKTRRRSADGARAELEASLERLRVDSVDLIQMHHLVDPSHWNKAMATGGALEGLLRAQEEGLTRFIGVTGHGTQVARRHIESLERHPIDSVLLPYTPAMMAQPAYAADFEELYALCRERKVAMQTIKAVARRRWRSAEERKFSWYEPLQDPAQIRTAVQWVLARDGVFLNTSSDTRILRTTLEAAAAAETRAAPTDSEIDALLASAQVEPLFEPGIKEEVGLEP